MAGAKENKNLTKHFKIIKQIGRGGFGTVFSAVHRASGKKFAVKVLTINGPRQQIVYKRFENEIKVIKRIKSKNVVRLFGHYITPKESYMAMELVEGTDLKTQISKKRKIPLEEAIEYAKEICNGLIDIHKENVVHRDLKPSNILITYDGTIKLIDFGISLGDDSLRLTDERKLIGSVQYVSPELVLKQAEPSPQSDIYALGIVLYEMLTGKAPFTGSDHQTIALSHTKREIPRLEQVNVLVPQAVENIIIKCTAKNPDDRYVSCVELYEDLSTCLSQKRANEPRLIIGKSSKKEAFIKKVNSKAMTISLILIGAISIVIIIVLIVLHLKKII
ncbi:serine/threonine protein kinase [Metamycoplasma arthritidis]|uniref:Serine/threonine protein kinase n=1 Tax=Metamycoplasma arthritidis (strain 158L3-1) TaxID=243272 RepID=B3PN76_META1|nr:serine/threonine-protein kinase [Metamycoplasma arthritidis]ACF07478.1 serine/threonine protein kinase [Metamycoplasma arthritidis 158L3-1]VEU78999.1 serine/threonine protein kinase [Metamycoplasma arthritidis]